MYLVSAPVAMLYFNPRPREEGDVTGIRLIKTLSNFNPRPREEGDKLWKYTYKLSYISIHALVKRATSVRALCISDTFYFNPRPREEGDKVNIGY